MKPYDSIYAEAIGDMESSQRISPFGFSVDISLIENPDLVGEIETALTIESAEMVLLTLRRVDEVILVAPHMIPSWKQLVDRLVYLDPENALKYVIEMSLYWNPSYAETMVQDAQKKIYGESFQKFTRFIRGTQAVGNELDMYGVDVWTDLIMDKYSREGAGAIILFLLDIFGTKPILIQGYCRTPFGTDCGIAPRSINLNFQKRAAEIFLLFIEEYISNAPSRVVLYDVIPHAVKLLLNGGDGNPMIDQFFAFWKQSIVTFAQSDRECALQVIFRDPARTVFSAYGSEIEALCKQIQGQSPVAKGVRESYGTENTLRDIIHDWCFGKNDARPPQQAICQWKEIILKITQTNPEHALNILYKSLEPWSTSILEEDGAYGEFGEAIYETIKFVFDIIFDKDSLRGLQLCDNIFRERPMITPLFSRNYLFEKIMQHIDSVADSHPDLVLNLYCGMDAAWSSMLHHGGGDSDIRINQRHQKIFESIPRTAEKNLLGAIRGCEYLLVYSEKDSEIHGKTLLLWREYMKQLEKRHTVSARRIYSEFHAKMRHIPEYEYIAIESDAGYERCVKNASLQANTCTPLTAKSIITENPGN